MKILISRIGSTPKKLDVKVARLFVYLLLLLQTLHNRVEGSSFVSRTQIIIHRHKLIGDPFDNILNVK